MEGKPVVNGLWALSLFLSIYLSSPAATSEHLIQRKRNCLPSRGAWSPSLHSRSARPPDLPGFSDWPSSLINLTLPNLSLSHLIQCSGGLPLSLSLSLPPHYFSHLSRSPLLSIFFMFIICNNLLYFYILLTH